MPYLLAIVLALALAASAFGQTFRASALAGLNLSQIDGDDLLGFHQPGLNAGLRVVAMLGERWRVGPEIIFSQQGAKRNRNSLNISDYREFRLTSVELPLMVYYKDWRITAEAGVGYQRLIDYRIISVTGDDVSDANQLGDDLFALKLGATLYLTPRLGFDFRWSRHLADIQTAEEPRWRGRTITMRAVYTFGDGEELPERPPSPQ